MRDTPDQVQHGSDLYHNYCSVCHGPGATASTGGIPDLRYASPETHQVWNAIVVDGAYSMRGMAGFGHVLSKDDSEAIQAYVVDTTRNVIALCETEYRKNYPELLETACTKAEPGGAATAATAGGQ